MYFMLVQILSLILTSFHPHYGLTLVPFHPTSMTPPTQLQPPLTSSALTLWDKLRTQTFRKGATHKLKPSPSDITAIVLSNSVISPWDHHITELSNPRVSGFKEKSEWVYMFRYSSVAWGNWWEVQQFIRSTSIEVTSISWSITWYTFDQWIKAT